MFGINFYHWIDFAKNAAIVATTLPTRRSADRSVGPMAMI